MTDPRLGQKVKCTVREVISVLDGDGIVTKIDGDYCTVKFLTRELKIHKSALMPASVSERENLHV